MRRRYLLEDGIDGKKVGKIYIGEDRRRYIWEKIGEDIHIWEKVGEGLYIYYILIKISTTMNIFFSTILIISMF